MIEGMSIDISHVCKCDRQRTGTSVEAHQLRGWKCYFQFFNDSITKQNSLFYESHAFIHVSHFSLPRGLSKSIRWNLFFIISVAIQRDDNSAHSQQQQKKTEQIDLPLNFIKHFFFFFFFHVIKFITVLKFCVSDD